MTTPRHILETVWHENQNTMRGVTADVAGDMGYAITPEDFEAAIAPRDIPELPALDIAREAAKTRHPAVGRTTEAAPIELKPIAGNVPLHRRVDMQTRQRGMSNITDIRSRKGK